ncbi:ribose 5-phosphate isomerase A-domain-containing protein [Fimicolochytrium jonesii]|uniref:ribose 5-phosphate isomerase A-domain-containing protein n=1 Tax=Fimicolochytrium jonesii TaxID=1396493 RepID=UPI0022FE58BC|nr:ribose 5-phosphate isomerase A-domain-containing protein [Fimicolochytrium jonesii]KAI8823467.1 ribose 5-phosphate isomerase A-domain-containing protein [Fimicolochytrium jonesii]
MASVTHDTAAAVKLADELVAEAKRKASYAAIDEHVNASTRVIGIGSGSTVVFCVDRLRERYTSESLPLLACIPTSFQSRQLIIEAGLPLSELNQFPEIDVAFDGADEVDAALNCIKGGGACQLQEKLVANAARKFVVVADYRKDSRVLGTQWKLGVPLEVIPMAYVPILAKLKSLGGKPTLRMAMRKAGPVVTDNGNFVIDAEFGEITDPVKLERELITIPGIVETGLFCGMAKWAYFGGQDGKVITRKV